MYCNLRATARCRLKISARGFFTCDLNLPSGLIGSRPSLYRNGRGFESRQLQDIVFLNTLSISPPVLTCSECVLC